MACPSEEPRGGLLIAGTATTRFKYRSLELVLWLVAAICFGSLALVAASAARAQREAQIITAALASSPAHSQSENNVSGTKSATSASDAARSLGIAQGQVIGRLEIPGLSLSVPITSGVESSSLLSGVGHVDGTAVPGGLGTIVLAGHRDTYLRPLERVAKGMEIRVADRTGTYRYLVDRWEVVLPEQVDSIAIRSRPELALVTCYPFHFVGAAPQRFVVHAHLVSVLPDTSH